MRLPFPVPGLVVPLLEVLRHRRRGRLDHPVARDVHVDVGEVGQVDPVDVEGGDQVAVVVGDEVDVGGLPQHLLDLVVGAVDDDLGLAGHPDLLELRAVVVGVGEELLDLELDAVVALGELEDVLEAHQGLLVLVEHHHGLPVEGLDEVGVGLRYKMVVRIILGIGCIPTKAGTILKRHSR